MLNEATAPVAPASEREYLDDVAARIRASWPAGFPHEAHLPAGKQAVTGYVRHWARTCPDKTAIVFYGREIAYGDIDRWSDGIATWLIEQGVSPGERIAVYLPTGPAFTLAFLGILKAGAIVIPVNPLVRSIELHHYLEDSGARLCITTDSRFDVLTDAHPGFDMSNVLLTAADDFLPDEPTLPGPADLLQKHPRVAGLPRLLDIMATEPGALPIPAWDDIAVINYTGGTTGLPKGCMHSHGDMVFTAASTASFCVPIGHDDTMLSFLPTFWIAGEVAGILAPVVTGCTIVLLTRWDAETVMQAIDRYRVSVVSLVTDGAVEILRHPRFGEFDFSSLKQTTATSLIKVLNAEIRAEWAEKVGTVLRESAYGMTETNTMDTFTTGHQDGNFDLSMPPVFCGLPVPGTEIKITDPQTGALCPLGQEGIISIRTPSLLKGYWGLAEGNDALKDGWFNTGDFGMVDERGFLIFRGRRKEMLKVSGVSVFPAEIEALLMRNPAVAACGVVGRDDDARGQVPVAFVRLVPDVVASPEELVAWSRENMAFHKVPEVRIVESLPMTDTGKIKRGALAELL